MTGTTQKVPIMSDPDNAQVTTNTGYQGTTPCIFDLERKKSHLLSFKKEGYKNAQVLLKKTVCGSVAGNIVVGGIVGAGVDAVSGAMWKLTPEEVNVTLEKSNQPLTKPVE
jgi:hypothetical protein